MSMRIQLVSLALLGGLCAAAVAQPHPAGVYDRYGYSGLAGGYRHASTFEEGVQRGYADIVRSAGAYNLMTSEAYKNYEDARSAYFDNRIKWTQTYFQMRDMNRQARAAERGNRLTSEQLYRIAADRAPDALSASDLDPLTGDITWPLVLEEPKYAVYRDTLERLFAERARKGASSSQNYLEIQRTASAAMGVLKSNIKDYPSYDYLKAKNFLEGMAVSARGPAG